MGKVLLLLFFFILITSCGGLSDAGKVLRNEKKATTALEITDDWQVYISNKNNNGFYIYLFIYLFFIKK